MWSAVIPLLVWAAVSPRVVGFSGGYSSGLETFIEDSIVVAITVTVAALVLVGLAWRGRVRPRFAVLASGFATLAILVPPEAMSLGG